MIQLIEGREDILRQKAEYDADFKRRAEEYDSQYEKYEEARYQLFNSIKEEIERQLGTLASGNQLYINVSDAWGSNLKVHVDNGDNPHDNTKALAWRYDVELRKNGEVVKETGSWSGLNGTTPEQLENLEYTVEVLKALNNIDWKNILDTNLPEYSDYITVDNPRYDRNKPDFNAMLFEADMEDFANRDVLVYKKGPNYNSTDIFYYKILKVTPKYYDVAATPAAYINDETIRKDHTIRDLVNNSIKYGRQRIAKDKFRAKLGNEYATMEY